MQISISSTSVKFFTVLVIASMFSVGTVFAQRGGSGRDRSKSVHVWGGHRNPKIGNNNQNPPHMPLPKHPQKGHPTPNPTRPTHGPIVSGPGGPIKAPVSYSRGGSKRRHHNN